jgi:predicted ATPase/DNA-binding SARP family transcriptional activator
LEACVVRSVVAAMKGDPVIQNGAWLRAFPAVVVAGQNERVQVDLLGPLEVRDGAGSAREVSGTRLRALLTLLALRAGQVVPPGWLIGELWGERQPADAPNALQALVSRLRRVLGDPEAVLSGPAGYRLAAARDDVDVFRFERLAARGRAALAVSPAEACGLLGAALALWRGEPLTDAAETGAGGAAIARLAELRLAVTEDRIDAELRLGAGEVPPGAAGPGRGERLPRLVAELEGLLAASPVRETLAALLMRALAADGRRAAALGVYEQTRELLADELGADPSPQLAALHLELLRADGQRSAPPRAAALPALPAGQAGRGHANGERAGTEQAAGDADRARRGNLPAAVTSFLGRDGDVDDVGALLRAHRLVTLTGPGGAGKTRLAVEAARAALGNGRPSGRALPGTAHPGTALPGTGPPGTGLPGTDFSGTAFPGGGWLAELAPVTDPAEVAGTVLSAFGLREQALLVTRPLHARPVDEDALDRLVSALAGRRALLVLDNCEHVIAAAAVLADRVLAHCPGIRVLATSREPLNITGEALWPVGPLAESPAEQLFTERAAAVSPGFRLTPGNSPAVSRICRALDGMPLAIELAAARTRSMTPAQVADRLDQRFRLLTGGSRTALPRHQTLRAVVDWSWDLLDDAERAVLRRLSAFTGGATLEAAEQVCTGFSNTGFTGTDLMVDRDDVLDLLAALADKSLVVAAQTEDGPRYRMLETIREYGRDRLAEAGETEQARRRHAAYFLRSAERAGPHLFGAGQLDWLRVMGADADNVHMAIRGAVAAGDTGTAVGLVSAFGWYWWLRSMKHEAGDLTALALGGAPSAAQAIAALADEAPDITADQRRQPPDTYAAPQAPSRGLASGEGPRGGLGGASPRGNTVGEGLPHARGGPRGGRPSGGDTAAQTWIERLTAAYGVAGMLVMDSPRYAESVAWLRQAEELAGWLGQRPGRSGPGGEAANGDKFVVHAVAALAGPLRLMIESHGRAAPGLLDAAVNDSYPWVTGLGRVLRGQLCLNQGRMTGQAEADFRAAAAVFEELGERWGLAMAVGGLAQVEEWRGELPAAAGHYEQAARLAGELGTTEDETQSRLHLAHVLWHLGAADKDRSRAELARALRDADRLGWPEVTAYAAYVAGNLARLDGDLATARERLETAATWAETYAGGLSQVAAVTCTARGYLAAAEGDLADALHWHRRALAAALPTGDYPVVAEVLTGLADTVLRGGEAMRAAALVGAAEGVRGTRARSDEDGKRVAAAARELLGTADYAAAFQRGRAVTPATLEAALADFLTPGA